MNNFEKFKDKIEYSSLDNYTKERVLKMYIETHEEKLEEKYSPFTSTSTTYYDSIIDELQNIIGKFLLNEYSHDDCPPIVTMSVNSEYPYDRIMMTLTHNDISFTDVVFPRSDRYYGYEGLFNHVNDLYHRTM